jgi:hypothetical protein
MRARHAMLLRYASDDLEDLVILLCRPLVHLAGEGVFLASIGGPAPVAGQRATPGRRHRPTAA